MAAQHGGRSAPPTPAPHMSMQAPLTAPLPALRSALSSAAPPPQPVSLSTPRPDADRTLNEYVETPFRAAAHTPAPAATADGAKGAPHHHHQQQHHHHHHHHHHHQRASEPRNTSRLHLPLAHHAAAAAAASQQQSHAVVAITKQPVAFTKEQPARVPLGGGECASSSNIMCRECGRCRCESCRSPRPLPERWVCHEACLCSAGALIDYASCLCCVKGLYYHCSNTDAGATCADEPCSCGPHRRLARWACLGALAAVLPCLLCYWPLRVCQRAVEAAYARHSRAGCRCRPHPAPAPAAALTTPEKRLLSDSSPDF